MKIYKIYIFQIYIVTFATKRMYAQCVNRVKASSSSFSNSKVQLLAASGEKITIIAHPGDEN